MASVNDGGEDRLAPVIPLFGGKVARASELPADESDELGEQVDTARRPSAPRSQQPHDFGRSASRSAHSSTEAGEHDAEAADRAEEALVRKLRSRSLSVSEARQVLRDRDLDRSGIDDVIDRFCERGYLNDALLAEHLVTSGVERKGQGRVALSRALAQRGIPRDVIDAALDELPDDDADRALEFARSKARSLARLDFDTALRRLVGQLARRGYGGSVAMTAARTALNEASLGGSTSGVRFVDSD